MPKVKLRNVNPVGYTDAPQIGRVGPSPHHGDCGICVEDPSLDHEHEIVNPEAAEAGSGCLVPGEVFEVDADLAGVAPFWRPVDPKKDLEPDGRLVVAHRIVDGAVEVLDAGSGLLANVGIFELASESDGLDRLKLDELKAYAAAQEPPIDLGDATTKKAILAAIRKG